MLAETLNPILRLKEKTDLPSLELPLVKVPLRGYQKVSVGFLTLARRCVEGSCTGAGKTAIALAAVSKVLHAEGIRVVVVFTLKSALRQWIAEIGKFLGDALSVVEICGDNGMELRLARWEHVCRITEREPVLVVANWEVARLDSEVICELLECRKGMLVLDEVTKVKNPASKTSRALYEMQKRVERVYGLSATAVSNELIDLYGIYMVVEPSLFGRKSGFLQKYCRVVDIPIGRRVVHKIAGYKNVEALKSRMTGNYIGWRKPEICEEWPEVVDKSLYVELQGEQLRVYREIQNGVCDLVRREGRLDEVSGIGQGYVFAGSRRFLGPRKRGGRERETGRAFEATVRGIGGGACGCVFQVQANDRPDGDRVGSGMCEDNGKRDG
jgi:SNF2 family DNA or RNA helicase